MANPEHLAILLAGVENWNAWRRRDDTHPTSAFPDLQGSDLKGADLTAVDFNHVDLDKANLTGANLTHADLSYAKLTDGVMTKVNLSATNLHAANLRAADIKNADLTWASLSSTDVAAADFSGSIFARTILSNLDLSRAVGLESVSHDAPSTVGVDTLFLSRGEVPEGFLRGAGLPDTFITYCRSLIANSIQFYSCFISYSHLDKNFARQLHGLLQERGVRCWLDEKQLMPGHDIYDQVDRGIRLWDKILLCCSRHSLTSWWVHNEIGKAFAKEQQLMKERNRKVLTIIPINLDGFLFTWQDGKADEIRGRYAADFTGWEEDERKFEQAGESVIRALRADHGGREPVPDPKI
jgi:hypothetical protein